MTLATCAAAWTPESVRPAATIAWCFAEDHGELVFDRRLNAVRIGLPLPPGVSVPSYAIVSLQRSWHALLAAGPWLDDGQALLAERTLLRLIGRQTIDSSAWNGTPRSCLPPLRSTIAAGADDDGAGRARDLHGFARRAAGRHDVFDDEDFFPGSSVKPRRSVSVPSCRSAKIARTPSARADFLADHDAAKRGRQHGRGAERSHPDTQGGAERLRIARMLEHERALQIAGAVQS